MIGLRLKKENTVLCKKAKSLLDEIPASCPSIEATLQEGNIFLRWLSMTSTVYNLDLKPNFLVVSRMKHSTDTTATKSKKYFDLRDATVELQEYKPHISTNFDEGLESKNGICCDYCLIVKPDNCPSLAFRPQASISLESLKEFVAFAKKAKNRVKLSNFRYKRLIGRGRHGEVCLVEKKSNKKLFAIKHLDARSVQPSIIRNERIAMELTRGHPFILDLDYCFYHNNTICFVTQFMNGGDMFNLLSNTEKNSSQLFKEDVLRFYACEIILGVEHLHNCNILHRDIKPENILISATDGHIKICDMGIVKRFTPNEDDCRTSSCCGTSHYLAPEMLSDKEFGYTFSADWWMVGCVLFEMLTGYPPFFTESSSKLKIYQRILKNEPVYPKCTSKELSSLLSGLLEKNPHKRLGDTSNEALSVKRHPFFKEVNWNDVLGKKVKNPRMPPSPGDDYINNFAKKYTDQEYQVDSSTNAIIHPNMEEFLGF